MGWLLSLRWLCAALVLLVLAVSGARAEVKLSGTFTATQICPAVQSIKKETNPGDVFTGVGVRYVLRAKNKTAATHYLIDVEGVSPSLRWVRVGCGTVSTDMVVDDKDDDAVLTAAQAFFILAISWQPAFCESHSGKAECVSQTEDSYEASHFTLHGLWPQPRSNVFCKVSAAEQKASEDGRWRELPEVVLAAETRKALDRVMPGTQSALDRHEWIKHGTCYGMRDMETYFKDSIRLMEELNATAAADVMAANTGKLISASTLRQGFDQSLGAGASDRMRFVCKKDGERELLTEITIGLKGDPTTGASLKDLIMAATPTNPGCPEFVVDPVGLQ